MLEEQAKSLMEIKYLFEPANLVMRVDNNLPDQLSPVIVFLRGTVFVQKFGFVVKQTFQILFIGLKSSLSELIETVDKGLGSFYFEESKCSQGDKELRVLFPLAVESASNRL